jgi:hypothetical protein
LLHVSSRAIGVSGASSEAPERFLVPLARTGVLRGESFSIADELPGGCERGHQLRNVERGLEDGGSTNGGNAVQRGRHHGGQSQAGNSPQGGSNQGATPWRTAGEPTSGGAVGQGNEPDQPRCLRPGPARPAAAALRRLRERDGARHQQVAADAGITLENTNTGPHGPTHAVRLEVRPNPQPAQLHLPGGRRTSRCPFG